MTALAAGALAFVLMALSDWLGALRHQRGAGLLFPAGCLLLAGSTGRLIWAQLRQEGPPRSFAALFCLLPAAAALVLLIYTLFFALPSAGSSALPPTGGKQPLADQGFYALCRHPGVLWLGLFYGSLWAALGGAALGCAFFLFTGLDLFYVFWQDRWVFPHTITGYRTYQQRTPFLIPTLRSIRACAAAWRKAPAKGHRKKKGS